MLKKFCNKQGCTNTIDYGRRYCEHHKYLEKEQRTEAAKHYDRSIRHKRDKKYTEFYHSPEWIATRQAAVIRDYGLCQKCLGDNIIKAYDVVHHIVPIKVNWLLRLALSNLICLCEKHHQQEHSKLKG